MAPNRNPGWVAGALVAALVASTGAAPAREPQRGCPTARRLTDAGAWTFTRLPSMYPPPSGLESSPIDSFAVDPVDPRIIYVADSFTIMRSTDRGCHWAKSFSLLDAPDALPNDHLVSLSTVRVEGGKTRVVGLVRRGPWPYADRNTGATGDLDVTASLLTGNGTDEWGFRQIREEHGLPVRGIAERLWIAPRAPASMYLTVTTAYYTADLYASEDGGATWERRLTSAAPGFGAASATCGPARVCTSVAPLHLAIDPRDPGHLFSEGREEIVESLDGGASWAAIQRFPQAEFGELQGVEVYAHRDGSLRVAAIGRFAWLVSEDGGKSWTPEEPSPTRSLATVDHQLDSWATGRHGDMVVAALTGQMLLRRRGRWIDVSLPHWGCADPAEDYERRHVCLGRLQYAPASRTYYLLSKKYWGVGPDGRYLVELTLAPR